MIYPLIDTHTHFDEPIFDADRSELLRQAQSLGVCHLLLVGYQAQYFARMLAVQAQLNHAAQYIALSSSLDHSPKCMAPNHPFRAHVALGLHPFYIDKHTTEDLQSLIASVRRHPDIIAIGEIGLDTFTKAMKQPQNYSRQQQYFIAQLDLAVEQGLPVLLHIRKAHADCLSILKQHSYDAHKLGGIAHSFSGGEQEAKAFVKLGFKLGVTGQITNPNAKKLRRAVAAAVASHGLSCLVIETDCPDMTPVMCQQPSGAGTRNTPANLTYVLSTLSELLAVPVAQLAVQLWQNSCEALRVDWQYPCYDGDSKSLT